MVRSILAIIALLAMWIIVRPTSISIEGLWKNDFYGSCLCRSENFYLFQDGRIIEYSDGHLTNFSAGSYTRQKNGEYVVTLIHNSVPASKWIVRPRVGSWTHPPDANLGILRWKARRFYRPNDESKLRELIISAPERDAKFKDKLEIKNKDQQAAPSNR